MQGPPQDAQPSPRRVSKDGEEHQAAGGIPTPQEGPSSAAAAVMATTTTATTTARVSANLEAARADALARTNAYLRGLLDSLVEDVSAATTPEEGADRACTGDDDGGDGRHGSPAGRLDHGRRRGGTRADASTSAGRVIGHHEQQQQPHGGPLTPQGLGAPERQSASSASCSASGLSRALRSLVDALQERDVQIQALEDERGPVRDGVEGVASAAEVSALREEVRRGQERAVLAREHAVDGRAGALDC